MKLSTHTRSYDVVHDQSQVSRSIFKHSMSYDVHMAQGRVAAFKVKWCGRLRTGINTLLLEVKLLKCFCFQKNEISTMLTLCGSVNYDQCPWTANFFRVHWHSHKRSHHITLLHYFSARAIHKSGKYCVVPRCENSVSSTPDKHFFPIPREPNLRQAWQCAMGNTEIVLPIYSYCCEDHFKLEKDTENYMQFKMMGNVKLKMKPKVVPSVFACQKKPSKRLLPDFVAVAEKKAKVEKSVRHQGTQTEKSLYMRDAAVQVDLGEEVEVEEKVKKTPKGGRKKRKIKSK
ncbi:uncharacterized protein isoform X10 [Leptinotarsa decemlineata]|uniref:uncharacterized protein isoform X10 n=1 Tax=Leptinotarsa decemlineata TaxID=7539 RepID=UPI003D30B851